MQATSQLLPKTKASQSGEEREYWSWTREGGLREDIWEGGTSFWFSREREKVQSADAMKVLSFQIQSEGLDILWNSLILPWQSRKWLRVTESGHYLCYLLFDFRQIIHNLPLPLFLLFCFVFVFVSLFNLYNVYDSKSLRHRIVVRIRYINTCRGPREHLAYKCYKSNSYHNELKTLSLKVSKWSANSACKIIMHIKL